MSKENRQDEFIDHYRQNGNIHTSCKLIGVSTVTFYNWKKNTEGFEERVKQAKKEARQYANEMFLDFIEDKVREYIENGSERVLIHSLKTKGRSRGWSERKELEIQTFSKGEMNININVPKPPKDILDNWQQNTNISDHLLDDEDDFEPHQAYD